MDMAAMRLKRSSATNEPAVDKRAATIVMITCENIRSRMWLTLLQGMGKLNTRVPIAPVSHYLTKISK